MKNLFPALAALGAINMEDIFKHIPKFREGTRAKKHRTPNQNKTKRTYVFTKRIDNKVAEFRCRQTGEYSIKSYITREARSQRLADERAA